jgi:hypothetical protein
MAELEYDCFEWQNLATMFARELDRLILLAERKEALEW